MVIIFYYFRAKVQCKLIGYSMKTELVRKAMPKIRTYFIHLLWQTSSTYVVLSVVNKTLVVGFVVSGAPKPNNANTVNAYRISAYV